VRCPRVRDRAVNGLESPDAGKPFAADTHRQSKLGFCACAPDAKQIMLFACAFNSTR
jgi:hypothetical protein